MNEIKNIKSSSHRLPLVRQLCLFLDDQGALRCGGRIHNAPTSELTLVGAYFMQVPIQQLQPFGKHIGYLQQDRV